MLIFESGGRKKCSTIEEARCQFMLGNVSLVLLDINLPDGNGLDFLKEIKGLSDLTPVILLTANDTDMDIVNGLDQGADDYITKPFSLSVLRARVNAQLRKVGSAADTEEFKSGEFVFDFKNMTFTVDAGDLEKYLGKPVFDESEIKKAYVPGTCIGLAWTSM